MDRRAGNNHVISSQSRQSSWNSRGAEELTAGGIGWHCTVKTRFQDQTTLKHRGAEKVGRQNTPDDKKFSLIATDYIH